MTLRRFAVLAWAGPLLGCGGQQYVSPDTVALVVTDESTQMQRVNRCHYIPVLLGSQVKFRYRVDGGISVTLSITRDLVEVEFEQGGFRDSSRVDAGELTDTTRVALDSAPDGYTAQLAAGCTPDDEYRL